MKKNNKGFTLVELLAIIGVKAKLDFKTTNTNKKIEIKIIKKYI